MRKENIAIRSATIDDLQALLDIEQKAFRAERFDRRQYVYLLTKANSSVYVLEIGRRVVGVAVMLWRKNSRKGRLYNMAIDPDFQGHGLAVELLAVCERRARVNRCLAISLEVRADNARAIALYGHHGYKVVCPLPDYYADGKPGLRMMKTLA